MKIQINRSILSSFLYFQAFPSACIYVFLHFFPYIFPYERFNKGKTILSTNKGYYSLLSVIPDFIKSLPRRAKYTLRTNLRFVLWVFRPCGERITQTTNINYCGSQFPCCRIPVAVASFSIKSISCSVSETFTAVASLVT